jgi:Tfp pilus assembly protein PilF
MMAEKSERRLKLEATLAADPGDSFLRYGLGMQCLREGDLEEGRRILLGLIADRPDEVPAYQQLGQSFMDDGEADQARHYFERGIEKADAQGNFKAANEMRGFLATLD